MFESIINFIKRLIRVIRLNEQQLLELKINQSIKIIHDIHAGGIDGLVYVMNRNADIIILSRYLDNEKPLAVIQFDKWGVKKILVINNSIILNIYKRKIQLLLANLLGLKYCTETPICLDISTKEVLYGNKAEERFKKGERKNVE